MITDEQREKLVSAIAVIHAKDGEWHGYPQDMGWLRKVISEAVANAVLAERGELDVELYVTGLKIPDPFPEPWPERAAYVPPEPHVEWVREPREKRRDAVIEVPLGYDANRPGLWWERDVAEHKARFPKWTSLVHVGRKPYYAVPRPKKRHVCTAHTSGYNSSGMYVELCPCGGRRYDYQPDWQYRNLRPRAK